MSSISMEQLLGGSETTGHSIESEMDLYELGQEGIPKKSLMHLASAIGMSVRSVSRMLHISDRTLQRKREADRLDEAVSERVIQIAEVYSRGTGVFDTVESFQTWMNTANPALEKRKPAELLASRYGAQMVLDELGRIEHGVFS